MVVDVGGGIGSTSMLLASAFSSTDEGGLGLKFVIQDRPVVVEMGEKVLYSRIQYDRFVDALGQAWKAKCPELLESVVTFQGTS